MRYEGGRYRFTTEPNLNKVIIEREGAIDERRIAELLREATRTAAPQTAPFRVEIGVITGTDLQDEQRLTIGLLDPAYTVGSELTGETTASAEQIVTTRGATARTNKNAVCVVAADAAALSKARQTARTLAAMRDINHDRHRLERFNKEQREQLSQRLTESEERLPQQIVMAYRHLILLSGDGNGGMELQIRGPRSGQDHRHCANAGKGLSHRPTTGSWMTRSLPAALLSSRFHVMADDDDAVEIDRLLAFFYRLPRLPRLGSPDVLRRCLVVGVESRILVCLWVQLERIGRHSAIWGAHRPWGSPVPARHVARPSFSDGDSLPSEGSSCPYPWAQCIG